MNMIHIVVPKVQALSRLGLLSLLDLRFVYRNLTLSFSSTWIRTGKAGLLCDLSLFPTYIAKAMALFFIYNLFLDQNVY